MPKRDGTHAPDNRFQEEMDPLDRPQWPRWMLRVATRVDELLALPGILDRFQRAIQKWDRDRVPPVELLPNRRLTQPEKLAGLAAIHDVVCERVKLIDPFDTPKGWAGVSLPKARAGVGYTVLLARVHDLTQLDAERVSDCLADLETELLPQAEARDPYLTELTQTMRDTVEEVVELKGQQPAAVSAIVSAVIEGVEARFPQASTRPVQAGAEAGAAADVQAAEASSEAAAPAMPDRAQEALQQYGAACDLLGRAAPKDRDAYDIIVETARGKGKTFAYRFDTWQRYLRIGRQHTGQQKHKSRRGREARSIDSTQ